MKEYYIYSYEHVDDDRFMLTIEQFKEKFTIEPPLDLNDLDKVLLMFKAAEWEGDGEVKIAWIPPFATSHYVPSGLYVFHVKQKNNGTSFICSSMELENIKKSEFHF